MKVLCIGNSFTMSLDHYFPAVARAEGEDLMLKQASFGGCELARHWSYVEAEENAIPCRIYLGGAKKLRDILTETPWDFVSIQQASHDSWRPETFEPYAGNLVNYIHRHAPGAEVVVQQTWAYRADHPRFLPRSGWNIDQCEMHERLTANYREMADRHKLRMIPTGNAVKYTRDHFTPKFVPYTGDELDSRRWPDLPPQAGDVVGGMKWIKNAATGELEIRRDLIHLNVRGEYLQACLWFAFLFKRQAAEINFVPDELGATDAAELRAASDAVLAANDRAPRC